MSPTKDVTGSNEGWETIVEPFADTFPFENEGDVLEGVYESSREVEQEDLNNPNEKRMAKAYTIADSKGDKFTVWGSFNVDQAMEKISTGSLVRFTYLGKADLKQGRTVNKFLIQSKAV